MRFDSVKELKGEVFRRLTGIQRNTFEAMAAVLSDAKCKQKAAGGKPNTLSVENQQPCWFGRFGPGCFATPDAAERGGELCHESPALRCGGGGVLRRPPSGPGVCRSGTRGPPDVAGIYAPLCEGTEERRSGRRGDRGGGEPADDAVC